MQMKKSFQIFSCIAAIGLLTGCNSPKDKSVPDEMTAISIAVAAWVPVYGKEKIESQNPCKASLSNGVWYVTGTPQLVIPVEGSRPKMRLGGEAHAEILQSDGSVLKIYHTK